MKSYAAICDNSEHERALCFALGLPEAAHYQQIAFDIADKIRAFYAVHGFRPDLSCAGNVMGEAAEIMRLGIELGRRLERAPILDALYCKQ